MDLWGHYYPAYHRWLKGQMVSRLVMQEVEFLDKTDLELEIRGHQ